MIAESSNQTTVGSAPQKRSLFNKPSWSRPQALSNDTELFHRSSQAYADLAAEAERARKRKLARKEKKRVHQTSTGERASKKRRASEDEDDEDDSSSEGSSNHSSHKEIKNSPTRLKPDLVASSTSPQRPKRSPKSLIRRYEAEIATSKKGQEQRRKPNPLDIIDLEDEQDSSASPRQAPIWKSAVVEPAAPPDKDGQPASDEEFPELARQAREKARRKRLEEDIVSTTTGSQNSQQSLRQSMPRSSPPDPVLQIFITSDIPNTIPLIVSRRLSQRLKDVRLAWLERQDLSTDVTDTIFLTWRGKRVFDVTTCKSLGITVDAIGRIFLKEGSWEQEQEKIHMEAMTIKMLEAYKASKRSGGSQEDDATQDAIVVGQDHEAQIRIILKAKGLDDFKLQVRPVRHLWFDCLPC